MRFTAPSRIVRPLALFALQAALWAALTFAFAALLVLVGPFEWSNALRISAINWLPWAALTPVIFLLARKFPLERGRLLRSVPVHIIAGLASMTLCLWISANAFPLTRTDGRGAPQNFRAFGRGGPDGGPNFRRFNEPARSPGAPTSNADRPTRDEFFNRPRPLFDGKGPGDRFGPDGPDGRFGRGRGFPGGPENPDPSFLNNLRRDFFGAFGPFALRGNFGLAIYLIVLSAAHALGFYRRAKERDLQAVELAASLTRAKLDALRLQLQPHFLFNTLNAISTLVHRDANQADELIGDLSDLLRLSLLTTDHEVPLARELELLDRYLAIEQTRLGDRLKIVRDIDPAATAALVPTFVLQPLAENSIRHGLEPRGAGGTITITARATAQTITLAVADDGVGLSADQLSARRGIGLANTEARLQALHGSAAKLDLITPPEGGLRVELTLPFKTASQPDKPTDS
jgi:two-component sensor histidine kinase